jgi:hypothetical protein
MANFKPILITSVAFNIFKPEGDLRKDAEKIIDMFPCEFF